MSYQTKLARRIFYRAYRILSGSLLALFLLVCCTVHEDRDAAAGEAQYRLPASADSQTFVPENADFRQRPDQTASANSYKIAPSTSQQSRVSASPENGSHIHVPARGCWNEHDAFVFPNGNRIEFYPYKYPYRFDHLLIHYANGDEIWGQPTYTSPDCPDSNRCQKADLRLNPTWRVCVPSGHLYEIHTLDGRPVLMSNLLQVIDPATKLSVNLPLALAQTGNIPTNGFLALGLAELSEEAGAFEEAQRYIDVASRSLEGTPDPRIRAEIEGNLYVASGNMQRDLGSYAQALEFYGRAVEKFRSAEDHKNAAATLNKIGEAYRQIGDYRASAQWYDILS